MEEYRQELAEYEERRASGDIKVGLLISGREPERYVFSEKKRPVTAPPPPSVKAKDVQEALKTKTATPDLLLAEIDRLEKLEQRNKELDREKVQARLHEKFKERIDAFENNELTDEDQIAMRLCCFNRLITNHSCAFVE